MENTLSRHLISVKTGKYRDGRYKLLFMSLFFRGKLFIEASTYHYKMPVGSQCCKTLSVTGGILLRKRNLLYLVFDARPVLDAGIVMMFYFPDFAYRVGKLDYRFRGVTPGQD